MELQETKFSFVYSEIKQRIMNNHIPPGDYLPSSRMLCNQFNVSRYTINRVFDALKEEGLIEIKPRIAPIVLSRTVMPESK
ncbi:winged helix-turn-helix domain-containing protein, partial [Clostridioides difficile]